MKPSERPFHEALAELLAEQDVSQRQLAKRTQKHGWGHTSTINFLAQGETRPSVEAMERIAQALNVRPEFFAEYRLAKAREGLDPTKVSLKAALRNLGER